MRLAALLLLLPLLCNCAKEPINRDIEGHWKLERFTILDTDETVTCERIFWGITRAGAKLFEKQGPHGYAPLDALIEYRKNETVLVFKEIFCGGRLATKEELHPYGLNDAEETVFQVEESTHKKMVLVSDYARLELKKF